MRSVLVMLSTLVIFGLGMYQPALAGVVFTINSTDKQTGESLGSMEVLVEGPLLKMTVLDSDESRPGVSQQSDTAVVGESSMTASAMAGAYESGGANKSGKDDSEMVYNAETDEEGQSGLSYTLLDAGTGQAVDPALGIAT